MKPQKLTMSAFGSYGGVEVIDFTSLDSGIFLITGDTGAGKTTIFDAISYALFGEVSGAARDGSMMRSHYAPEDGETYVELVFQEHGECYCVRRSPAYERTSKRKNKDGAYKKVSVGAKASLILPDGREFPGNIRDINQKIQELTGVDREQFAQITMIAQGEYLKLLHASSRERKLIFSKIFQTGIYGRVQLRLKEEYNRLYGQLEDNRKLTEHERKKAHVPENSAFFEPWKALNEYQETKKTEFLDVLQQVQEETKSRETALKKQRDQIEKERTYVETQLSQAKEINKNFEQKRIIEKKIALLEGQAEEIRLLEKQLQNIRKAEKVLPAQHSYEEAESFYRTAVEKSEQVRQEISSRTEELERAKKSVLASSFQKAEDARKKHEKNQKALIALQKEFEQADVQYNQRYGLFLEVQAGIMAAELEDGAPCPVCGSTNHPKKADCPKEDISQQWVEEAKNIRDELEQKRIQAAELCIRSQENLLQQEKTLKEQKEKWQDIFENEDGFARLLSTELESCKRKIYSEKELDVIQETLRTLEGMQKAEMKNAEEKRALASEKSTHYMQIREQEGFRSESDYLEVKALIGQKESWEGRIKQHEQELLEARTGWKTYDSLTKGREPVDVTAWKEASARLESEQKSLHKEEVSLAAMRQGNQQVLKNLKGLWNRREELEKEYRILRNLYQTANGKIAGQAGVDFQTFVQRRYFNQMIQAANRRLKYMTDGQFILQCREMDALGKQGEVGLDLDVYSIVTGKTRDVKTLSGGESFMAALSMALGMADIIQNLAGNVRVETMFLDEGFGSLDDDARLRAIRILQELTGQRCSIGIISHVTELKEQIERKLIVKKDEKGSRIYWENGI